jgi:transposase
MSKSTAARLFGVSLSSVKRYARIANRGASLEPRKGSGRPPKADEITRRLLEEDVKERPAATVSLRDAASWNTQRARPSATPPSGGC